MKFLHSIADRIFGNWPLQRLIYLSNTCCGLVIAASLWDWLHDDNLQLLNLVFIGVNAYLIGSNAKTMRIYKQAVANSTVYNIPAFLIETLFNGQWITQHQKAVCDLLPTTWTHVGNLDVRRMVETLREFGMAIDVPEDFYEVIKILVHMRLLLRNGDLLKRNPINVVFVMEQGGTP